MLRTVMSNLLRGGSEIYSQVSQRTKECQFHLGAPRMAFPCGFCAEQPKKPISEMERVIVVIFSPSIHVQCLMR